MILTYGSIPRDRSRRRERARHSRRPVRRQARDRRAASLPQYSPARSAAAFTGTPPGSGTRSSAASKSPPPSGASRWTASAWTRGASTSALLGADGTLLEKPFHYRDSRNNGVMEKLFPIVPREDVFEYTGIQMMQINSLVQLFAMKLGEIAGAGLRTPSAAHPRPLQLLADRRREIGSDHRQHLAVLQPDADVVGDRTLQAPGSAHRDLMPDRRARARCWAA